MTAKVDPHPSSRWRLHPPPSRYFPAVGDLVFIRPRSRAEPGRTGTVAALVRGGESGAEPPVPAPRGGRKKRKRTEEVRAVVRGEAFEAPGCRPSRLVPVYRRRGGGGGSGGGEGLVTVVLTPDTCSMRILAASQVRRGDRVLEIGCSTGECTAVLARAAAGGGGRGRGQNRGGADEGEGGGGGRAGSVVAFDTGSDMIARAREHVASAAADAPAEAVRFHRIDALADPRAGMAAAPRHPDAIFVDIGGNRELAGVARMLNWVLRSFCRAAPTADADAEPHLHPHLPRIVVVKSQALVRELMGSTGASVGDDGAVPGGSEWFSVVVRSVDEQRNRTASFGSGTDSGGKGPPRYSHPQKAPLALNPTDGKTPVCRFHNYHAAGCLRGERCEFDHVHCHWCLRPGHRALECSRQQQRWCPASGAQVVVGTPSQAKRDCKS